MKNNKDKCKIIINENEFELCSHINIDIKQINNGIFEIKLKGINKITNLSNMFKGKFKNNDFVSIISLFFYL